MASKTERTVVNVAGLVQGIVLVTFPAASTIFTSKSEYGLSDSQYGIMFLPQVALAIVASLLGARLARATSTKRVYLLGGETSGRGETCNPGLRMTGPGPGGGSQRFASVFSDR